MNYRNKLRNLYATLWAARKQEQCEAGIHMANWLSDTNCGTAGCLLGSLYIHNRAAMHTACEMVQDPVQLPIGTSMLQLVRRERVYWPLAAVAVAGSYSLAAFLFSCHSGPATNAISLSSSDAIRRLEKTIAYLERKQNLWDTDPETLRKQEGDWGFVMEASRREFPIEEPQAGSTA